MLLHLEAVLFTSFNLYYTAYQKRRIGNQNVFQSPVRVFSLHAVLSKQTYQIYLTHTHTKKVSYPTNTYNPLERHYDARTHIVSGSSPTTLMLIGAVNSNEKNLSCLEFKWNTSLSNLILFDKFDIRLRKFN